MPSPPMEDRSSKQMVVLRHERASSGQPRLVAPTQITSCLSSSNRLRSPGSLPLCGIVCSFIIRSLRWLALFQPFQVPNSSNAIIHTRFPTNRRVRAGDICWYTSSAPKIRSICANREITTLTFSHWGHYSEPPRWLFSVIDHGIGVEKLTHLRN